MGGFKHEQRHLAHRGRTFHFISYEAQDANSARQQPAMPDTWYLVSSGRRWPAIPRHAEHADSEVDALLTAWLEACVFGATDPAAVGAPSAWRAPSPTAEDPGAPPAQRSGLRRAPPVQ
jgi:hypothetical protein